MEKVVREATADTDAGIDAVSVFFGSSDWRRKHKLCGRNVGDTGCIRESRKGRGDGSARSAGRTDRRSDRYRRTGFGYRRSGRERQTAGKQRGIGNDRAGGTGGARRV